MGADERVLADFAAAILDGTAIDWASVQSGEGDADRLPFGELRVLATIAALHRDLLLRTRTPPTDTASDNVGDNAARWGHLRLLEPIGRGAFGEVYRAWDPRLDREVALKLLSADASLADARASEIIKEGRLLARVHHPNVVTIHGAERIGDRIGLWMEFVKGRTLAQAVEQGGVFEPASAVHIGIELCHAVAAVHHAGLLHRDIKAHNVMLSDDGRVVLMDFGTGQEVDDDSGGLAGTPLYLAPELLTGAGPSGASDIYSVGVLLYYMLTGSFPVRAAGMRALRLAHERAERAPIRTVRPDVPPKLARIVERAMDPRPEHRHDSADALGASLTALEVRPPAIRVTYTLAFATLIAVVVWVGSSMRGREAVTAPRVSAVAATTAIGGTPGARGFDPAQRPVIAVLPLKNLSAEPDSDYFADGLTDELIRNLAVIDGLDVRSRTSSFFFKDKPRNLRDVAEQLRVNLVVEGSVLQLGKRLRINAQLVRVAGDVPLWSERFDRELKDIFAIQDEISRAIVNHLRLTLGRGQRRYDTDPFTYDLYLKGRELVAQCNPDSPTRAAELFRQVITRDPEFAPAHAGLAAAYAELSKNPYMGESYETAHPIMRSAALQAVQLDPMLAEAHVARGLVYAWEFDWENARKSFGRALELNATLTDAYTSYSDTTLIPLGQYAEAERLLDTARRHDPLSPMVLRELGHLRFQTGKYDEAIGHLERVKAAAPDFASNPGAYLGRALMLAGRLDEALDELKQVGSMWLAHAYVRAGRRPEAEKMLAGNEAYPFRLAIIYAALDDTDPAFEALARMRDTEPNRLLYLLTAPELSTLRGDVRFAALRKSLNLPPEAPSDPTP